MAAPVIRTKPAPDLGVPEMFSRLIDIAYNLCWSWSPKGIRLFSRLDPARWSRYRNPIELLIDLEPRQWETLQDDPEFARAYHAAVSWFDDYTNPAGRTWFDTHHGDYTGGPFAYFSTEYGWHECLQIYSGGLGVLSGDHCKSASDLGLPFIGIGLMYKHGYFRQTIDAEGLQQHFYPDYDMHRLPLLPVVGPSGRELYVPIDLPGRRIQLRLWKASVGRISVLLLDSDLPINHPADRSITSVLYVRGREMRLCQEAVLGAGGFRVLQALGLEPAAWHMNEGHSGLLSLARMVHALQHDRVPFDEALRRVASNTIFTTHTPVPAGNEVFDAGLVRSHVEAAGAGEHVDRLVDLGRFGDANSFNMTALSLRTSGRANAVSQLHATTANSMWSSLSAAHELPAIDAITNGVHCPSWVGPEVEALLIRYVGADYDLRLLEEGFDRTIDAIPAHELWTAHRAQKARLVRLIREWILEQYARHGRSPEELRRVEELMDPEILTIGFARRFATYKRADLILRDVQRLRTMSFDANRPVQFVFAGKAHPADRPGQDLIRRISIAATSGDMASRMVFLENYDLRIARNMVQGVDVWLNNPRRPHEASGTSGMKGAMNGVLNCSILDGWWCEGFEADLGWAIGSDKEDPNQDAQDHHDAQALYDVLEREIVPLYYDRNDQGLPAEWIRRMKRSMARLTPRFSSARMVREYVERLYLPASRGELAPAAPGRRTD
jgi:starch phosphorylase